MTPSICGRAHVQPHVLSSNGTEAKPLEQSLMCGGDERCAPGMHSGGTAHKVSSELL